MKKIFTIFAALTLTAGLWAAAPANAESVDLGLPSGLKWATFNVGATTPEGYGDYFAWGETSPKTTYGWNTYFDTKDDGSTFIKYNIEGGKTTLELEDDAARQNWGGNWRMPTKDEWDELIKTENCKWEWKTNYNGTNVSGYLVTSTKNGNSIFLPASSYRDGTSLYDVGVDGNYWSSSLNEYDPSSAYYLYFSSEDVDWYNYYRFCGQSVRPVYDPSEPTALPTLKNADKAPVRKYIKNGRFEMEINGKNYNALGTEF